MLEQFLSDLAIRNVHVPVLMVHGEKDDIVPLISAKRLFEVANERNRHCHILNFLCAPSLGRAGLGRSLDLWRGQETFYRFGAGP